MERKKSGPGRRLALNKETLRTLGDAELQDVAGGGWTVVILSSVIVSSTLTTSVTLTPGPNTKTNPPADPEPEPEPDPEPKTETP